MPGAAENPKLGGTEQSPVVIDLGKKRRKQIRDLRRGDGKLMNEVNGVLHELRTAGTISAATQPIIFVVRERRRSRRMGWPLL